MKELKLCLSPVTKRVYADRDIRIEDNLAYMSDNREDVTDTFLQTLLNLLIMSEENGELLKLETDDAFYEVTYKKIDK